MSDSAALFTDGKSYERLMGRWSRLAGEKFLTWLDAPKGLRWIDVGCGNGAFTEELVTRCAPAAVVAIDPSDEQLAFARARPGTGMVDFRNAGAQELPFPSASLDVAVMALAISFVPDPARAVLEMARVARPGGIVATYMWDFVAGGAPLDPVAAAMRSLGINPPLPPKTEASRSEVLQGLWEGAGLESIESRPITITVAFSNFEDFWESNSLPVGPLGKAIETMSTAAKEELRVRLRDQLPIAADGRIAFESRANAIKGRVPKTMETKST
jgi:ubiquinone/menaquinone biosynthesis C-methylase UbiE